MSHYRGPNPSYQQSVHEQPHSQQQYQHLPHQYTHNGFYSYNQHQEQDLHFQQNAYQPQNLYMPQGTYPQYPPQVVSSQQSPVWSSQQFPQFHSSNLHVLVDPMQYYPYQQLPRNNSLEPTPNGNSNAPFLPSSSYQSSSDILEQVQKAIAGQEFIINGTTYYPPGRLSGNLPQHHMQNEPPHLHNVEQNKPIRKQRMRSKNKLGEQNVESGATTISHSDSIESSNNAEVSLSLPSEKCNVQLENDTKHGDVIEDKAQVIRNCALEGPSEEKNSTEEKLHSGNSNTQIEELPKTDSSTSPTLIAVKSSETQTTHIYASDALKRNVIEDKAPKNSNLSRLPPRCFKKMVYAKPQSYSHTVLENGSMKSKSKEVIPDTSECSGNVNEKSDCRGDANSDNNLNSSYSSTENSKPHCEMPEVQCRPVKYVELQIADEIIKTDTTMHKSLTSKPSLKSHETVETVNVVGTSKSSKFGLKKDESPKRRNDPKVQQNTRNLAILPEVSLARSKQPGSLITANNKLSNPSTSSGKVKNKDHEINVTNNKRNLLSANSRPNDSKSSNFLQRLLSGKKSEIQKTEFNQKRSLPVLLEQTKIVPLIKVEKGQSNDQQNSIDKPCLLNYRNQRKINIDSRRKVARNFSPREFKEDKSNVLSHTENASVKLHSTRLHKKETKINQKEESKFLQPVLVSHSIQNSNRSKLSTNRVDESEDALSTSLKIGDNSNRSNLENKVENQPISQQKINEHRSKPDSHSAADEKNLSNKERREIIKSRKKFEIVDDQRILNSDCQSRETTMDFSSDSLEEVTDNEREDDETLEISSNFSPTFSTKSSQHSNIGRPIRRRRKKKNSGKNKKRALKKTSNFNENKTKQSERIKTYEEELCENLKELRNFKTAINSALAVYRGQPSIVRHSFLSFQTKDRLETFTEFERSVVAYLTTQHIYELQNRRKTSTIYGKLHKIKTDNKRHHIIEMRKLAIFAGILMDDLTSMITQDLMWLHSTCQNENDFEVSIKKYCEYILTFVEQDHVIQPVWPCALEHFCLDDVPFGRRCLNSFMEYMNRQFVYRYCPDRDYEDLLEAMSVSEFGLLTVWSKADVQRRNEWNPSRTAEVFRQRLQIFTEENVRSGAQTTFRYFYLFLSNVRSSILDFDVLWAMAGAKADQSREYYMSFDENLMKAYFSYNPII